jgi:hypothetical protein
MLNYLLKIVDVHNMQDCKNKEFFSVFLKQSVLQSVPCTKNHTQVKMYAMLNNSWRRQFYKDK